MNYFKTENYIKTTFGKTDAYIFLMDINSIMPIYYVAVRGRDKIEGAVQRVLNKRRLTSISDFVLQGNMFFNTFILNWTDTNYSPEITERYIKIPIVSASAQVIDGQHRLEGLKMACEKDKSIGNNKIIVVMTNKITTQEAANIFLNINTEQKPVPKTLVYDLFAELKPKDYYLVRANDIAEKMHTEKDSPYYQSIKVAGAAQGIGKVDFSTVVNAFKQYTTDEGIFQQYNLSDLESQYKVVNNFFQTIKFYYESEGIWLKSQNPFMMNAGFHAAIKFLCEDLIPKCAILKSFEITTMKAIMAMDEQGLIYRDDIKNLQGKEQRNEIYKFLKKLVLREVPNTNEYKF
ncbi:DGQHR domain-containing protein [Clostridium sp. DJ247]|uniref:DGQHR domain-containing protein n=1 Tax=Clostridium sp. DJ247 TaxID=2726188 RepID=UPI001629E2BB|nr:DGQHR domain-containing protein [Clostridium sp. DJ247]MBC2579382.1 DGQHR domain-containing protein [Clostridium sp. DJ247]